MDTNGDQRQRMKKRIWVGIAAGIYCLLLLLPFFRQNMYYQKDIEASWNGEEAVESAVGDKLSVLPGIYQVEVFYESSSTNHMITAGSELRSKAVKCDAVCLERGKVQETVTVWVTSRVDDFQVFVQYLGVGSLHISEITVKELMIGKIHRLFCGLLLLAGVLVSAFLILHDGVRKKRLDWKTGAWILAAAVFSSLPLLREGIYWGHDSIFHLLRIEGLSQGLKSGQFPVRIQPNWLHGYGYAVSIFYGELILYIPALLRIVGFSLQSAYKWYVFGINLATALTAYYCFRRIFGDKHNAVVGSILYTLAPYRLVNIYVRAAVGEFSAMLFLPLVLLGFWSVLWEDSEKKRIWPLVAGFTGLLQTHMISCEMAGLFSALFCLISVKKVLKKENLRALLWAVALTIGLNLWFLVPFLEFMRKEILSVNTEVLAGSLIQNRGMELKGIWNPWVYGGVSQSVPLGLGVGLQLPAILLFLLLLIGRGDRRRKAAGFLLLAFSLLSSMMATNVFPWDWWIEKGLHFLASVQFPWRFLSVAAIFLSAGGCLALCILKENQCLAVRRIFLFALVSGAVVGSGCFFSGYMDKAGFSGCYEMKNEPYHISGGEYLPADVVYHEGSFHSLTPQGEEVEILSYEKTYNRAVISCRNLSEEERVLYVPILLYRRYEAYDVETGETFRMFRSDSGMTGIYLPSQYEGTLCMRFRSPLLWRLAETVSVGVFCLMLAGRGHRRWRKGKEA